ncbi:MAG TPA: hypothetical protein VFR81_06560 [Longimicrobium sp.]|nr:hypothetical protein [Longimicrobium sp.]
MAELHKEMEDAPAGIDTDVVYTNEAFHLAGELAGREMDIRPFWAEYVAMMDRIYAAHLDPADAGNPPPGVLGAA